MSDLSIPRGDEPISGELLVFAAYEEMAARPGFVEKIDPKTIELIGLVGYYPDLRDEIGCGLTNCHRGHKKGFLFACRILASGRVVEALMGHICGKKYFGIAFTGIIRRKFTEHRISTCRNRFLAAQQGFPQLLARIAEIRACEYGACWLEGQLSKLRRQLPAGIYSYLQQARANDGDVFEARELDDDQAEIRRAMRGQPAEDDTGPIIEHVKVGTFRGLEIFADSVRPLLFGCERLIKELGAVALDGFSEKKLRGLAKQADEIPQKLNKVEELISAGQLFFTSPNYDLLCRLAKTHRERRAVERVRKLFKSR